MSFAPAAPGRGRPGWRLARPPIQVAEIMCCQLDTSCADVLVQSLQPSTRSTRAWLAARAEWLSEYLCRRSWCGIHGAGEKHFSQRAARYEANPELLAERQDFRLRSAVPQRVFAPNYRNRLDGVGSADRTGGLGHPEVLHLAALTRSATVPAMSTIGTSTLTRCK